MANDNQNPDHHVPFNPDKCPICRSINLEQGYGLAGGGIGVYTYCCDCGQIFDKVQTGDA